MDINHRLNQRNPPYQTAYWCEIRYCSYTRPLANIGKKTSKLDILHLLITLNKYCGGKLNKLIIYK